jgi:hypothetical protein
MTENNSTNVSIVSYVKKYIKDHNLYPYYTSVQNLTYRNDSYTPNQNELDDTLLFAVETKQPELVEFLIKNVPGGYSNEAISKAFKYAVSTVHGGDVEIVVKILELASNKISDKEAISKAFEHAALYNKADAVVKILELASAKISNEAISEAFKIAASYRNTDAVVKIWELAGAKIRNEAISKAFEYATSNRNTDVVVKILELASAKISNEAISEAFEYARRGGTDVVVVVKLLELASDKLSDEAISEAFKIAASHGKTDAVVKIWELASGKINDEVISEAFKIAAASYNNTDVVVKIWELASGKISDKVISEAFKEVTTLKWWHSHPNSIAKILELASDKISNEVISEAFESSISNGRTDFAIKILEFASDKISNELISKTFKSSPLFLNMGLIIKIIEFASDKISDVEAISETFKSAASNYISSNVAIKIVEFASDKISNEAISQAFKSALSTGRRDLAIKIVEFASDKISNEAISQAFKSALSTGRRDLAIKIVEFASDKISNELISEVFKFALSNGRTDLAVKIVELASDKTNNEAISQAFKIAASYNNTDMVVKIWELAGDKISDEAISQAFKSALSYGRTDLAVKIVEFASDKTNNEAISEAFKIAASYNNTDMVVKIWELAGDKISDEAYTKIFKFYASNKSFDMMVRILNSVVDKIDANIAISEIWQLVKDDTDSDALEASYISALNDENHHSLDVLEPTKKAELLNKMTDSLKHKFAHDLVQKGNYLAASEYHDMFVPNLKKDLVESIKTYVKKSEEGNNLQALINLFDKHKIELPSALQKYVNDPRDHSDKTEMNEILSDGLVSKFVDFYLAKQASLKSANQYTFEDYCADLSRIVNKIDLEHSLEILAINGARPVKADNDFFVYRGLNLPNASEFVDDIFNNGHKMRDKDGDFNFHYCMKQPWSYSPCRWEYTAVYTSPVKSMAQSFANGQTISYNSKSSAVLLEIKVGKNPFVCGHNTFEQELVFSGIEPKNIKSATVNGQKIFNPNYIETELDKMTLEDTKDAHMAIYESTGCEKLIGERAADSKFSSYEKFIAEFGPQEVAALRAEIYEDFQHHWA